MLDKHVRPEPETGSAVPSAASSVRPTEVEAMVEAAFSRLSLDDKIAQLQGIRPDALMENGRISPEKCRAMIPRGIGHLCQFASTLNVSPEALRDVARDLQQWLVTETPARIPALIHEEGLTGLAAYGATSFPQAIGMGCTWNPALVEEKSRCTAATFRAAGATLALSPMLDLGRSAHWSRLEESLGEDATLTSALGLAFVKGLQGDDLRQGVAATGKHFAGYGHEVRNRQEFFEEDLLPFETACRQGDIQCIMPGYHHYDGIPCTGNGELLTDILRGQLGFTGLTVSDYSAISLMVEAHFAADREEAGVKAMDAGIDVDFPHGACFSQLGQALVKGRIAPHKLDDAVKRSLRLRARLGLLDETIRVGQDGTLDFDPLEHREVAYRAACQSLVLLKNDGVLPLKREVNTIALVGPNADSIQALLGDYTYQSMSAFWWGREPDPARPRLVTLLEGLRSRGGDRFEIRHERGCDWSELFESSLDSSLAADPRLRTFADERMDRIKAIAHHGVPEPDQERALRLAAGSDVIIAAMGENQYLCGEGRERPGIRLPGQQEAFVKRLLDTGKPVVLVIFGGRPQVIDTLEPRCAAVVQAWYPGEEGGHAVADLLFGNINPSGKLCVTYPRREEKTRGCYNDGYPAEAPPQYPFGHGLSYTRFAYRDLELAAQARTTDEWIDVVFKVRNAGDRDGEEVVQLYVAPLGIAAANKPLQLRNFQRIALRAGEETRVAMRISPRQLACFRAGSWCVEPGRYEFRVAASSTDIRLRGIVELIGGRPE